ncbi:MAG: GNAT family N-acyltransferase [Oleiphilaceae bacterium]|nr:GNAT family N-acyltransferase [Oleiphilaceae bacterium]
MGMFPGKKSAPSSAANPSRPRIRARWLTSRRDILRAQRLRYRTFSEEFGIRVSPFGLDRDRFDRHCLHLGVEDLNTGQLVGYTRVLHGEAAQRLGGFYARNEFDLAPLSGLKGQVLEVGRTCIHREYRNGATIATLWSALAAYLFEQEVAYLIGCASIPMADGGQTVADIMSQLRQRHLTQPTLRLSPHRQVPLPEHYQAGSPTLPPLIKAYLRMGAKIAGEPCWDPAFNCADVFILLPVDQMTRRYKNHFLAKAG